MVGMYSITTVTLVFRSWYWGHYHCLIGLSCGIHGKDLLSHKNEHNLVLEAPSEHVKTAWLEQGREGLEMICTSPDKLIQTRCKYLQFFF